MNRILVFILETLGSLYDYKNFKWLRYAIFLTFLSIFSVFREVGLICLVVLAAVFEYGSDKDNKNIWIAKRGIILGVLLIVRAGFLLIKSWLISLARFILSVMPEEFIENIKWALDIELGAVFRVIGILVVIFIIASYLMITVFPPASKNNH